MTTHLDVATLSELREIMQDGYEELLQTYLADAVDRMACLEEAATRNDHEYLRNSAHSLKGSSSNIGAVHLAELTQNVESLARENLVEDVIPMLDDIRVEYGVVRSLLEEELRQNAANS